MDIVGPQQFLKVNIRKRNFLLKFSHKFRLITILKYKKPPTLKRQGLKENHPERIIKKEQNSDYGAGL